MTGPSLASRRVPPDAVEQLDLSAPGLPVHEALQRIVQTFDLRHVAYLAINLPTSRPTAPYIATTYAAEWVAHYRAEAYHRSDPVIRRGLDALLPLDWSTIERSAPRVKRLFGEAADFGIGRQGLSFPIRGRSGERAVFSITSDASDRSWQQIRRELTRDFQILAFQLHNLVLSAETKTQRPVSLAPREIECLHWAANGKTHFETAKILGLSERTVIFYLETARHKLDASNTTHAVAKAVSMNLIALGL